jgi:hypothetical protein
MLNRAEFLFNFIGKAEKDMLMVEYDKYFKNDLRLTLNIGVQYKQENKKKTDFISYVKI